MSRDRTEDRARRDVRLGVDAAAAALCAVAAALVLGDVHTPVRAGLVLVALVAGTGWAATCWIDITEAAFAAAVALATGLAVDLLFALFFVEIGWWHPQASAGALLAAAAIVNAVSTTRHALWRAAR